MATRLCGRHACDANFLPFRDGGFDVVVGRNYYWVIIPALGGRNGTNRVLPGKMIIAFIGDLIMAAEK